VEQLHIDSSLRNTNNPKKPDDAFGKFFRFSDNKGINNTSGFRPKSKSKGSTDIEACAFCVLVTNFMEVEWPDHIDRETGIFNYFGDKKTEGDLHITKVGGNRFLRDIFNKLHTGERLSIPPILIFENYKSPEGSQMRFVGLAAPGAQGLSAYDDLVAVWRVKGTTRFQNYRSVFTILKAAVIDKAWLNDLVSGTNPIDSVHCPDAWKKWVKTGIYTPLTCTRKREPRGKTNQLPHSTMEVNVLHKVMVTFTDREFEFAAVELIQLMDPRFTDFSVTQRVRDGGRDGVGIYKVGHEHHQIHLSAIIEAKLWKEDSDVGVKPMTRLISRIKHRDIGVFITTSCFSKQVQQELIDDNHPIILVSGGDIARVLIANELNVPAKFDAWAVGIKQRSTAK
jgi:hypothetical protein